MKTINVELNVSDFIALIQPYYDFHCTGGSLHVALDDGNLSDETVDFCIGYAKKDNDSYGLALGKILRAMTEDDREELYELYREYCASWVPASSRKRNPDDLFDSEKSIFIQAIKGLDNGTTFLERDEPNEDN